MQTLFYRNVSFQKRYLQHSFLLIVVSFIISLPLFFLQVNIGTYIIGSILFMVLILFLIRNFLKCIYWIQELSFSYDSNRLRIVLYKYDDKLEVIEGALSDFNFYLIARSGKNSYSYKLKIVGKNREEIEQYQISEWNKEKMEYCIKEIYKRGGKVKFENLPLNIQDNILY